MWIRNGRRNGRSEVDSNGVLKVYNVTVNDSGIYDCQIDDIAKVRVNLLVKSMFIFKYI